VPGRSGNESLVFLRLLFTALLQSGGEDPQTTLRGLGQTDGQRQGGEDPQTILRGLGQTIPTRMDMVATRQYRIPYGDVRPGRAPRYSSGLL
jgi:hypothetical protein